MAAAVRTRWSLGMAIYGTAIFDDSINAIQSRRRRPAIVVYAGGSLDRAALSSSWTTPTWHPAADVTITVLALQLQRLEYDDASITPMGAGAHFSMRGKVPYYLVGGGTDHRWARNDNYYLTSTCRTYGEH